MRNNYSTLICITLLLIATIIGQVVLGQNKIKVEEFPNLAKKITNVVPEGKALFVFEAKEDYQFDSDNENIVQPIKDGLLYKLYFSVETSSGAITIQNKLADKATINYGRDLFENSLPALKRGEIWYFKLSLEPMFLKPKLEFADVTRQKKAEGAADLPTYNLKDALIIFNVVPKDLKIKIEGKKIDTVFKDATGVYKVYVHPEDQVLVLKSDNYTDESVPVGNLYTKDVRYYYVQQPLIAKGIEGFDADTKTGDYLIQSVPPGALIQMTGQPYFNERQFKTPYTIKDQKAGTEIITLTLDRYEPVTDTILISSRKGEKNKSNYNLIEKFAFINCNIEPAFPISKIVMDGKELTIIKNGEDFECPKGIHTFEIVAPHYYTETRQINLAAGKASELNIKLKPKMGSLTVLPGENADNAEVFINEKNIGKLPIQNYHLQEGDYIIKYLKKNLVTSDIKYNISIKENNSTTIKDVKMFNTKEIKINTYPVVGATVFIDDINLGKTNLTCKIGIGKHSIKIEKENYGVILQEIDVLPEKNDYSFELVGLNYPISIKTKATWAKNYKIYVDGTYYGETPQTLYLPTKTYNLELKMDNTTVYHSKINHPIKTKTRPYNIYRKFGFSIYSISYSFSEKVLIHDLISFSFSGLTLDLIQFQKFHSTYNDRPEISSYVNPEFKVGGNLTGNSELSIFVNYYIRNTTNDSAATNINIKGYSYGIAYSFYPSFFGIYVTLKAGMENSNNKYKEWDGLTHLPAESYVINKPFVSLQVRILSTALDGQILRLWQKPLFYK